MIASGIYIGNRVRVEAFKEGNLIRLLADNYELKEIQVDFEQRLNHAPPIGGTFHPKPDTLLAAFSVLQHNFFDKLESIRVEGKLEEIPNEPGKVY